jgi:hypothetical protein
MRANIQSPKQIMPDYQRHPVVLYASLELSRSTWLVTSVLPGGNKMSKHITAGGDGSALLALLARLRSKAEQPAERPVSIAVIQEAGLDGFWVHRLLEANGIASHVVDPASIAVPRRRRRAKTDAIDGETLLRTLLAWERGEPRVCAMVVPPTPLPRARDPAPGAGAARQSDQGFARRPGDHRLRTVAQGTPGPP